MSNKKALFVILSFAVVAALLTFYRNPGMFMGPGMMGSGERLDSVPPMRGQVGMDIEREYSGSSTAMAPSLGTTEDTISFRAEPMAAGKIAANSGYIMPGTMPAPYYANEALGETNRVYDYSAYQGVVANNVSEYVRQAKEHLQSNGGRIMHSSQQTVDDMQYAYIDARIPVEKFEETTALFASRAKKVMTESINAVDVTGQKKNLDDQMTRLEERKAERATALAAAATTAERQRIQAEIDQINRQIESLTNSQEQFTEQVSYATISLTVADSERYYNPEASVDFSYQLKAALRSLKATGRVVGILAIWVAVYAVIWLPIIFGIKWLVQKFTRTAK